MSNELLNGDELAKRLRVQPGTVGKWAREGRIPEIRITSKVRRFDFEEVLQTIRRLCRRGRLPGAYRLGRRWRVTESGVRQLRKQQDKGEECHGD